MKNKMSKEAIEMYKEDLTCFIYENMSIETYLYYGKKAFNGNQIAEFIECIFNLDMQRLKALLYDVERE